MDLPENSLIERASSYFTQLSSAAKDLNKASDDLGLAINAIDSALQKLNLGVATWVKIHGGDDVYSGYWRRDIGYARVGKKWGIALCTREGDHNFPEDEIREEWLFNEAPRWLRVEGIERIPDLLEALVIRTKETTDKIKGKTAEAKNLASAIVLAAGKGGAVSDQVLEKAIRDLMMPSTPKASK